MMKEHRSSILSSEVFWNIPSMLCPLKSRPLPPSAEGGRQVTQASPSQAPITRHPLHKYSPHISVPLSLSSMEDDSGKNSAHMGKTVV